MRENSHDYRYSQRAYLVQIRRRGSGTALIDPVALPDLTVIQDKVGDVEWVLHAASQDLPCLAELGLHRPRCSTRSSPAGCSATSGSASE